VNLNKDTADGEGVDENNTESSFVEDAEDKAKKALELLASKLSWTILEKIILKDLELSNLGNDEETGGEYTGGVEGKDQHEGGDQMLGNTSNISCQQEASSSPIEHFAAQTLVPEGISEYEKIRETNVAQRKEMLKQLKRDWKGYKESEGLADGRSQRPAKKLKVVEKLAVNPRSEYPVGNVAIEDGQSDKTTQQDLVGTSGKDEASSEEVCQGAGGVNLLRDADEEAVDDVEAESEQEVQHGEDGGLVDADTTEYEIVEGVEQTHKEPEGNKKNTKRTVGKERRVPCDQPDCTKTFRWPLNLKHHINVVHKKSFMCDAPSCTKKFGQKQALDRHTANFHKEERPFKCKMTGCSKDFGSKNCLDKHMAQVHLANKAFKCPASYCEKIFGSKIQLEIHQRSAGHGKEKLRCSYAGCTALFNHTGNLSTHIRAVHLKEKRISCVEQGCGEKFQSKQMLENHLRRAHGAPKLACKQTNCTAVFNSTTSLSYHVKCVHLKEKRLSCVEQGCVKQFRRKQELEDHLRCAHRAPKLACKQADCTATFVFATQLYKHMKMHH